MTPQGLIAVCEMVHVGLPEALRRAPRLVAVLVEANEPGNAGAVLRTADASGVSSVVFAGDSVDPYNPKTVRASAGSIFHVPFGVQQDLTALVAALSGAGYRTVATTVRTGLDYTDFDWSQPTALFRGQAFSVYWFRAS